MSKELLINTNMNPEKYAGLSPAMLPEAPSYVWRSVLSEIQGRIAPDNNLQMLFIFKECLQKFSLLSCWSTDGVYAS